MADRRHSAGGTHRGPLIAAGVAAVVLVLAGGVFVVRNRPQGGETAATAPVVEVENVDLQITPVDTTADVELTTPVVVHISSGHLDAVMAASPSGKALTGAMAPDRTTWLFIGTLEPAATYSVSATGTTPKGQPISRTTTFTTLTPSDSLTPTITPSDGLTVGVAQPIVVKFNNPVADKREMLKRLDVTMSNPVFGAWHWFTDKEVHFRPKEYWPTGNDINVTVDVTGWDNGDGVWGDGVHTSHFAIGDARISTVDLATYTMTVTKNGEVVRTMPMSAGNEKYPTMTGTHLVMYRQQDVLMDSSTVGIPLSSADGYRKHVYYNVAITDGGEFVHAAPWSVASQGRANVSHGCVNLSQANAEWFFEFSRMGDAIKVINGPREPELGDHGVMDWETPWEVWMTPPPPTPTSSG